MLTHPVYPGSRNMAEANQNRQFAWHFPSCSRALFYQPPFERALIDDSNDSNETLKQDNLL